MKNWDYDNEQWTKLPSHLKHLPLFTRHLDYMSVVIRSLWSLFLKFVFFKLYIRLQVVGDFKKLRKTHPRLILISNHCSHLDALSIVAAVPFGYWLDLYVTAAKDYFFSNPLFAFFSKHCLGAIPVDRKDKGRETIQLISALLNRLDHIWLLFFPEGTRSPDGHIHAFKRGISIFSERTHTPILFLYLQGSHRLWPKGRFFSIPGSLKIHVGPVHPPSSIQTLNRSYLQWVQTIDPEAVEA